MIKNDLNDFDIIANVGRNTKSLVCNLLIWTDLKKAKHQTRLESKFLIITIHDGLKEGEFVATTNFNFEYDIKASMKDEIRKMNVDIFYPNDYDKINRRMEIAFCLEKFHTKRDSCFRNGELETKEFAIILWWTIKKSLLEDKHHYTSKYSLINSIMDTLFVIKDSDSCYNHFSAQVEVYNYVNKYDDVRFDIVWHNNNKTHLNSGQYCDKYNHYTKNNIPLNSKNNRVKLYQN